MRKTVVLGILVTAFTINYLYTESLAQIEPIGSKTKKNKDGKTATLFSSFRSPSTDNVVTQESRKKEEKSDQEIVTLTSDDACDLASTTNQYQRRIEWPKYKDKRVEWTLRVDEVSEEGVIKFNVLRKAPDGNYWQIICYVYFTPRQDQMSKVLLVKPNQAIRFSGVLTKTEQGANITGKIWLSNGIIHELLSK